MARSWQDMNNIELIMAIFYENLGKIMARSCKLMARLWQKFNNCSFLEYIPRSWQENETLARIMRPCQDLAMIIS